MSNMRWDKAIRQVMDGEARSIHYTEIAELIVEQKLRTSVGATPASTVNAVINVDIKDKQEASDFVKVDRGYFILRKFVGKGDKTQLSRKVDVEAKSTGLINCFGIYWSRDKVLWKSSPDLLGVQQMGADVVNFSAQIGVYLLHDVRETIYVGQAIKQSIPERLNQHTTDRLGGRWDRFSWFGFYEVSDKAKLEKDKFKAWEGVSAAEMADAFEAILIESIEPRQNRKKGNAMAGIEYLQQEDPEFEKKRRNQMLDNLKKD